MGDYVIPRALSVLSDSRNPAADAALLEALPLMKGAAREAALNVLVDRGHIPSLVSVLSLFHGGDKATRAFILRRFAELHGAVRAALTSPAFDARLSAIEAIVAANEWQLSYAVADALQSKCPRSREIAAATLAVLVENYLKQASAEKTWIQSNRHPSQSPQTSVQQPTIHANRAECDQEQALTDAAAKALRTWERHYQPRALETALWLGARIVPALQQKLEERSTKIARAIADQLTGTKDPRLAEFCMCALMFPQLRQAAVAVLHSCRDPDFIDAVVGSASLLDHPDIASGFRRVRQCPWLHESVDHLARLGDDRAGQAVRLLIASGGPHERKLDQLRSLVTAGGEPIHRAVLKAVMNDTSPAANSVLNLLVSRGQDEIARTAAEELKRREVGVTQSVAPGTPGDNATAIRAALRSSNALDRLRTLTLIRERSITSDFSEQVYHAAHDPDPTIRSLAVAMLVDLPGATADRILRTAVEDSDARVQANAIEVLDRLNASHRAASTHAKLHARNNRVRANAVHSLLRLELREAGDALLNMLQDPSPAHRISALWVIERLGLSPVRVRIEELGQSDPDPRVRERARRVMSALDEFRPRYEQANHAHNPTANQYHDRDETSDTTSRERKAIGPGNNDKERRSPSRPGPAPARSTPDREVQP